MHVQSWVVAMVLKARDDALAVIPLVDKLSFKIVILALNLNK